MEANENQQSEPFHPATRVYLALKLTPVSVTQKFHFNIRLAKKRPDFLCSQCSRQVKSLPQLSCNKSSLLATRYHSSMWTPRNILEDPSDFLQQLKGFFSVLELSNDKQFEGNRLIKDAKATTPVSYCLILMPIGTEHQITAMVVRWPRGRKRLPQNSISRNSLVQPANNSSE